MQFYYLFPEIILFIGALTILMLDVFFAKKLKEFFYTTHILSFTFCAASLFVIIDNFLVYEQSFNKMLTFNPFLAFIKLLLVSFLIMVITLSLKFVFKNSKISAEFLALIMLATVGSLIMISSNDLLTFYLGLELQALPLYLLAAINKKSNKSSEAGMKYFILGSLASGMLLFGISLIYGFSGTTNFNAFAEYASKGQVSIAAMFGLVIFITAMFFKASAAPFHMWTPDVYEGSNTIVTTFFASVVKFSVLIALIRMSYILLMGIYGIEKIFIMVGLFSLLIGSFGAMFQKNLKRLLAYSSIGHVGFIILGIVAFSMTGLIACLVYSIIYAFISIGSFGFLNLIKSKDGDNSDESKEKIFNISALSGLAKTNPVVAFCFAALIFSSAGIPPLAGFFSKFYVISAIISKKYLLVAIVAVLFSVISAYYYLRIIKIMYFDESKNEIEIENIFSTKVIIAISAFINISLIFFMNYGVSFIFNLITVQ